MLLIELFSKIDKKKQIDKKINHGPSGLSYLNHSCFNAL